ncbi:MAG: MerR family transcriptional regulator [Acidimicrobiales bacterium]
MQIGELVEATGVSARSLRHYETMGLLVSDRLENGYRDYEVDAIERVRKIRALLATGMSLAEAGPLMPCMVGDGPTLLRCAATIDAVESRLGQLDRRIAELTEARALLAAALGGTGKGPGRVGTTRVRTGS